MIGAPFNDHRCMGSISEVARELVAQGDPVIAQIASEHATTEDLAAWIRSLPQRDDLGERGDGPKVETCSPPQRLRIPASDPNCVERAALYVAAAELIDPDPVRHLRGPLVFCDDMGGFLKINKLHRVMEATCKRAGLRHLGWHVLRHTFASHLAMRNVPLKAVQELLGHASIQMTMRYAHLSPNVSRSAVDLLDLPGVAAGWQQSTDNAVTA